MSAFYKATDAVAISMSKFESANGTLTLLFAIFFVVFVLFALFNLAMKKSC